MNDCINLPTGGPFRCRDSSDRSDCREASSEFNLEACGRQGRATIAVRPDGYWSDTIHLTIERKFSWTDRGTDPGWTASLSHSSGGRLSKADEKYYPSTHFTAIADDLEAEMHFGAALIAASHLGREILAHKDTLEAHWQTAQKERREAEAAEAEAKRIKFEADAALGKRMALALFRQGEEVKPHAVREVVVCERGTETRCEMQFSRRRNLTIRYRGLVVSRTRALEILAASSIRSYLKTN